MDSTNKDTRDSGEMFPLCLFVVSFDDEISLRPQYPGSDSLRRSPTQDTAPSEGPLPLKSAQ